MSEHHSLKTYLQARDAAVAAAGEAAHLIRRHAGRLDAGDVDEKGTHDLVTRIDREAQQIIIKVLARACPGYEVLAEEGVGSPAAAVAEGFRWIIDPIDGTTNFTHGVAPYAVSIGLQHEADVVVGVVLDVSAGELFTAVEGGGLYVNGVRAWTSRRSQLGESLITTGFPYSVFEHIDPYLTVLCRFMKEARGVRRPGSAAVDLAWVAAGRFDGFFETGLKPWDVAAGALLVTEGGGRITDFDNQPNPLFRRQVLATNGPLHEVMLEYVQPLRDAALKDFR